MNYEIVVELPKREEIIELDINQQFSTTFDNDQLELENKEIEQFNILTKLWKEDSNLTRSECQSYPDKNHKFAILNFTFK